jgi:hypothetical protein
VLGQHAKTQIPGAEWQKVTEAASFGEPNVLHTFDPKTVFFYVQCVDLRVD